MTFAAGQRASALAVALLGAAAAAQGGPAVEVTTVEGRVIAGALTATADELRIAPAQGEAVAVPLTGVLAVRATAKAARPRAGQAFVWLRSGTELPATRIDGIAAESDRPARIVVETPSGGHLELPLSAVAALRARANEPATLAADRAAPDPNRDYLHVVKDGEPQRFTVQVTSIHGGRVHFQLGGRDYDFALTGADSVAAVVFGVNTGFAPDRQGMPRVTVTLAGGERCEGKLLSIASTVALQLDEGARLEVPSDRLQGIEVATERLVWLSALQPRVEQTAAFDRKWPWTIDGSPAGPGIRLGGRTHTRGLVLVPRTRLVYDLGGRYDVFEAVIGIDERGGPQANAIFRVLGNGKVLFESEPMLLVSAPRALRVELGRCRELAIEADFGKNFDLGDLCAFADARVLQNR